MKKKSSRFSHQLARRIHAFHVGFANPDFSLLHNLRR